MTILAIPATGLAAEATIRIEGTSATVLPETAYVLPDAGTSLTIRDTADAGVMSVGGLTAAAQLGNASRLYGIGFGFTDWGQYGFGLDSIGGDPNNWDTGPVWFLRHNHRPSAVGAGSLVLADGDEVLWALSPLDGNYDMTLAELDVVAPRTPLVAGEAFTVRVDSYNNQGTRTPVAGALVSYRGATVTTGVDGTAALTAGGAGAAQVEATRTGAVRDRARVCAYPADDPTVCNLPPLPRAVMPTQGTTPPIRVPVTVRTATRTVTVVANVRVPRSGKRPVGIHRHMIDGADLAPAETRRAMGKVASALAANLNARAAGGDTVLSLPSGTTWQAAWLSGTPYVVPLREGEALMGVRSDGPRNIRAIRTRTASFNRHLERCGINATATTVRRHGYVLTTVRPAVTRAALVECVTHRMS